MDPRYRHRSRASRRGAEQRDRRQAATRRVALTAGGVTALVAAVSALSRRHSTR